MSAAIAEERKVAGAWARAGPTSTHCTAPCCEDTAELSIREARRKANYYCSSGVAVERGTVRRQTGSQSVPWGRVMVYSAGQRTTCQSQELSCGTRALNSGPYARQQVLLPTNGLASMEDSFKRNHIQDSGVSTKMQ